MTDLNLLALYNDADIETAHDLINRALQQIRTAYPEAVGVTLWQQAENGLVRLSATDSATPDFMPLPVTDVSAPNDTQKPEQQALATGNTHIAGSKVYAPLLHKDMLLGLLVLDFADDGDTPDAQRAEAAQATADDLCALLYAAQTETLLQTQIAVTRALNTATSLREIASTIAQYMAKSGQYVGMNIFNYDPDGNIEGAVVTMTANRHDAYPVANPIDIDRDDLERLQMHLSEHGDVLLSHLDSITGYSDSAIAWLKAQKAIGAYMVALPFETPLPAFISLLDTRDPLALSHRERDLFKNIAEQAGIIIETQQLLAETRATATESSEQARILRVMNDLLSTQGDQALLQKTAETLLDVTDAEHISLIMQQKQQMIVIAEAPDQGLVGTTLEGTDEIHQTIGESGEPFISKDVTVDRTLPAAVREHFHDIGIAALIILPMFDENNRLLGSIRLDYTQPMPNIDPETVRTTQTIASQVALSLQKSRLLEASQLQAKRLTQLTEFGQNLRAYLDLEAIMRTTLQYTPVLLRAEYVAVLLNSPFDDALRRVAVYHEGNSHVDADSVPEANTVDSIAQEAWQNAQLVDVAALQTNWEWQHPQERDLNALLALPLQLGNEKLGILEVGSATAHHFETVDKGTLRQIGTQIAIAVVNARAYAASQKRAVNKSQANDIIAQLQQQLEVENILKVTVRELGQAIGAKRGRIRLGQAMPKREGDTRDA